MVGHILTAMKKPSNKNRNVKALKLETVMEKPSNINCSGKAF